MRPIQLSWMATACSLSTGLGLETEGKEVLFSKLPVWDESKVKTFPMVRVRDLQNRTSAVL